MTNIPKIGLFWISIAFFIQNKKINLYTKELRIPVAKRRKIQRLAPDNTYRLFVLQVCGEAKTTGTERTIVQETIINAYKTN
jgi:hypothetical protein